ncbi:MAG: SDR family NAD(P)-dependent oxidoreductase [Gammaproteobacteria bacterium]
MPKTLLVTGATDGIGLETARMLVDGGHRVLVHGRNPEKLAATVKALSDRAADGAAVEGYLADLSRMDEVERLAAEIEGRHDRLDVLINNAGVFRAVPPVTAEGFDVRFAVNTLAPCLLTRRLLPLMDSNGRVINLSSAAQAPVDLEALAGRRRIADDLEAYAQSKLALTQWSRHLAQELGEEGPAVIAVNPGSLLGTKMVREGFGTAGKEVAIGARILVRLALDEAFAGITGRYFDNDVGRFADPHPDALDAVRCAAVAAAVASALNGVSGSV